MLLVGNLHGPLPHETTWLEDMDDTKTTVRPFGRQPKVSEPWSDLLGWRGSVWQVSKSPKLSRVGTTGAVSLIHSMGDWGIESTRPASVDKQTVRQSRWMRANIPAAADTSIPRLPKSTGVATGAPGSQQLGKYLSIYPFVFRGGYRVRGTRYRVPYNRTYPLHILCTEVLYVYYYCIESWLASIPELPPNPP